MKPTPTIKYGGYVFDDYDRDEQGFYWSYVCYFHSQALRRNPMISPSFDDVAGEGCKCGVETCTDEAESYLDMVDYKEV